MLNNKEKYSLLHYHTYLEIDKLLDSQRPRSLMVEGKMAHDELLFIIVHQAYELWFKQIIHEMSSIHDIFSQEHIDEKDIGTVVHRLKRVNKILHLAVDQLEILETMTPLDFLEFRDYLFPASGFQSFQFRILETMLGLKDAKRITYNNEHFTSVFDVDKVDQINAIIDKGSILDLVQKWLERTPFLSFQDFDFLNYYKQSMISMIEFDTKEIMKSNLSEKSKEMRIAMLKGNEQYVHDVLDREKHEELLLNNEISFSFDATLAALFINLFRDEPILNGPFNLLTELMELDETLTNWRSRHAQMVLRMIGKKIGSGGSSGHDYLAKTAKKHQIFTDLFNISTLLIPKSALLPLPDEILRELGFYYQKQD